MRRLRLITFVLSRGASSARADACPAVVPVPANAHDVECLALSPDPSQRCPTSLQQSQCERLSDDALARGLITADARFWLQAWGYCPVFIPHPRAGHRRRVQLPDQRRHAAQPRRVRGRRAVGDHELQIELAAEHGSIELRR